MCRFFVVGLVLLVCSWCFSGPLDGAEGGAQDDTLPLPSFLKALVELRRTGDDSPQVVSVPAGTHALSAPIRLTPKLVGNGLTLRGDKAGGSILSGGVQLQYLGREEVFHRYRVPKTRSSTGFLASS